MTMSESPSPQPYQPVECLAWSKPDREWSSGRSIRRRWDLVVSCEPGQLRGRRAILLREAGHQLADARHIVDAAHALASAPDVAPGGGLVGGAAIAAAGCGGGECRKLDSGTLDAGAEI